MNNLNSALLEGKMIGDPQDDNGKLTFMLASKRFFRQANRGIEEEITNVGIEVWGDLVDICRAKGHTGRPVRVVGWLRQIDSSGIVIVAEHIEYRPERKEGEEK